MIMTMKSTFIYSLFFFFFLIINIQLSRCAQENCTSRQCSGEGPVIQFPFRLIDQPESCGYPGFELFCQGNETMLKLPHSEDMYVKAINYEHQELLIYDAHGCLARSLLKLNLSSSPFSFPTNYYNGRYYYGQIIINCSSEITTSYLGHITCLSDLHDHLYFLFSIRSLDTLAPSLCKRITTDEFPLSADNDELYMIWNEPDCRSCLHGLCWLNETGNGTRNTTECLIYSSKHSKGSNAKSLIIGLVSAALAVGATATILLTIKRLYEEKKKKEQDDKIEKFLKEYKALKPTRYSYARIRKMSDNFKHKLGEGGYGEVFRGKLPNGVPVAIKVLEDPIVSEEEFINEVGTIGRIHHINVVRLLGFCVERSKRALIYEFLSNGSLDKFIYKNDDRKELFKWTKLHEIAIGIAHGIAYLHQGCEQRIVHFDIKPQNVLLDHKFTPKVSDFGLAKLCSKDKSAITMTAVRGTIGYIAPEVFLRNSNMASHKSDVYSFGMLLLEMVGGRKNTEDEINDSSQVYFPEWIYDCLVQGKELRLMTVEAEDEEIAKKLATISLWCIQWNPIDRPSMNVVVQMMEGNLESLSMPPNPFTAHSDNEKIQVSVDI